MEYMTPELYAQTRYFKNYRTEGWGNPMAMAVPLVFGLDNLRHIAGAPCIIHCGFETDGHEENSQHYLGCAADFHLVGVPVQNQFMLATKIPQFNGIGVYPYWNNKGLHCDVRDVPIRKYWWRKRDKIVNGKRIPQYSNLDNIYNIIYI